jgi:hypothetical protein
MQPAVAIAASGHGPDAAGRLGNAGGFRLVGVGWWRMAALDAALEGLGGLASSRAPLSAWPQAYGGARFERPREVPARAAMNPDIHREAV